ncbi:MAG: carbonic anhydrase [Flavobacteriales bacterium]|nr:carbonic anhydrase [Flavobacteriales bacterium]
MITETKQSQTATTPKMALDFLRLGNQRFTSALKVDRNLLKQVEDTREGQYPFAVVVSCIDSRVPVETVLDQGIGDIFSIRIAGNFINTDILGSIEFACKLAGAKLIVVMGHSSCGAVKGACDQVKLGNLSELLHKIKPAVDAVVIDGVRSSENKEFVQKVAAKNVELALKKIRSKSPVLEALLERKEIGLVGAMYLVETGEVQFGQIH